MDIAPHHVFCLRCGAAHPLHARFCGVCGTPLTAQNTGIQPEYAAPEQHSSVLSDQSSQSVPAIPKAQTPITSIDETVKQKPSAMTDYALSIPLRSSTRQLSAQRPAVPSVQSSLLKQRYQLIKQLGVGGYGIVHKALDTEFGGRLVAIKEMSQAELEGKDIVAATDAFKHEAFMLAGLTHPNLPSIYDYFTENGHWYLVMSYIEGETLEAYINRSVGGKLPVEKVLMIGSQLASVLSYLHKRNPPIIFRDLKPANIMRIPEGQIYLIDFGIARHFKVGQSKDTIALGSPGYAAPEQYGRAQSTPQTDVYSLGATLHHMLTGIDPSDSPFNHPPLDLPRYPQLKILITCMLDMDPRKRPASMGNIKRELQRISSGRSYPPGTSAHSQPRQHSLPPPSSQEHRARNKFWPALLTSSVPAEYTQKERGMRR
jgi:serine/threonine protein kinase